jgi:hypothetical protein
MPLNANLAAVLECVGSVGARGVARGGPSSWSAHAKQVDDRQWVRLVMVGHRLTHPRSDEASRFRLGIGHPYR